MLRWLVVVILSLLASPALAQEPGKPEHPCLTLMGDYRGGEDAPDFSGEIDGRSIASIADLAATTATARTRDDKPVLLRGLKLANADFRRGDWSNICFFEAELLESDWRGAQAQGAGFLDSKLNGSVMEGAQMRGVAFFNADLSGVKATGADWRDGRFEGGWFNSGWDGLDISRADLSGFTVACGITLDDGCPVYQGGDPVLARGANFTGAEHVLLMADDIEGAVIDGTVVAPSQLRDLLVADLRGPVRMRGGNATVELTAAEVRQLGDLLGEASEVWPDQSQPSFDCARATSALDRLICDPDQWQLKYLDRDMAASWAALRARKPDDAAVLERQRRWLASRSRCLAASGEATPARCLEALYGARIDEIHEALADRDFLARGEAAYFIEDSSLIRPATISHPLVQKLLPAIIGQSSAEMVISRNAAGRYDAVASAIGANAHSCSLGIKDAQLVPGGWFGAAEAAGKPFAPVFRHNDGLVTIFQNGHADYEKYPTAGDYASCGVRASFGDMRRVPLPADQIKAIRNQLDDAGL